MIYTEDAQALVALFAWAREKPVTRRAEIGYDGQRFTVCIGEGYDRDPLDFLHLGSAERIPEAVAEALEKVNA